MANGNCKCSDFIEYFLLRKYYRVVASVFKRISGEKMFSITQLFFYQNRYNSKEEGVCVGGGWICFHQIRRNCTITSAAKTHFFIIEWLSIQFICWKFTSLLWTSTSRCFFINSKATMSFNFQLIPFNVSSYFDTGIIALKTKKLAMENTCSLPVADKFWKIH